MANENEKLQKFSRLVMEDADAQGKEMIHSFEEKAKIELDEKQNQYLEDAYGKIQDDIKKVRKEDNERVLREEIEAKRAILRKREEIIDKIFGNVLEKLESFMISPEYEGWLLDTARKACVELGDGEKTMYVSEPDMKYEKALSLLGGAVELTDNPNFLGGIRVYNKDRKIAVDYSFGQRLAEQKTEFLQTSGLVIGE